MNISARLNEAIDKTSTIESINNIVNICKENGILNELRRYTEIGMRDYMLHFNPTADSRRIPWKYLIDEINSTGKDYIELEDFIDDFIREGNKCIEDNIK